MVKVIGPDSKTMEPVSSAEARILLREKKAEICSRHPFSIRMERKASPAEDSLVQKGGESMMLVIDKKDDPKKTFGEIFLFAAGKLLGGEKAEAVLKRAAEQIGARSAAAEIEAEVPLLLVLERWKVQIENKDVRVAFATLQAFSGNGFPMEYAFRKAGALLLEKEMEPPVKKRTLARIAHAFSAARRRKEAQRAEFLLFLDILATVAPRCKSLEQAFEQACIYAEGEIAGHIRSCVVRSAGEEALLEKLGRAGKLLKMPEIETLASQIRQSYRFGIDVAQTIAVQTEKTRKLHRIMQEIA